MQIYADIIYNAIKLNMRRNALELKLPNYLPITLC